MFDRMDRSGEQRVDLAEFVEYYHSEYTALQEEIEELGLRVKDQEHRAAQIEKRLEEIKRIEKPSGYMHPAFPDQYIMKQSILSVHVVDARDLNPVFGKTANA